MPEHFPIWVILTHFLNIVLLSLLARSGVEILAASPKLYWTEDCTPGREWLRLSKRTFSAESRRMWTSRDEEESWNPVVALPGRRNLGIGRHWHLMTMQFWILTGAVYVALVFASGYWRYLVPQHWSIVPDAIRDVGTYLQFRLPGQIPGQPFNSAQKLAYFVVVFLLAPLQILTGAAMSPAVDARFPWYSRAFGGRQSARSLHFLGLCAFALFTVVHTALVVVHGVPDEFAAIVLGGYDRPRDLAVAIGLLGIALVLLLHVVATWFSRRYRRTTQRLLGAFVDPMQRALARATTRSRRGLPPARVSPYHRVNGYPPVDPEYERLVSNDFADFRLPIGGLIEQPALLSLADLTDLGRQTQIVRHDCIQGWNAIAEWSGVPLARLVSHVRPLPQARFVVFYAFDDKGMTEGGERYGYYYEAVPLFLARAPQSLLVWGMNGGPLPIEHGAPLRVRFETQLGFKMVKWIRAVEFVSDYRSIGLGMGGWREDHQFYTNVPSI